MLLLQRQGVGLTQGRGFGVTYQEKKRESDGERAESHIPESLLGSDTQDNLAIALIRSQIINSVPSKRQLGELDLDI